MARSCILHRNATLFENELINTKVKVLSLPEYYGGEQKDEW